MSKKRHINKKELVIDVAKDFGKWVFVTGAAFIYWMVVLLVLSLVLLNVWRVSFEEIVHYSIILMIVTSVVYLGRIIYNWLH